MSDSAVAAPEVAAPVATPKKAKAPKAKVPKVKTAASHPPYLNMVKAAIKSLKDRKGASKQAILKYISQNYKLGDNVVQINAHLRQALKRGVAAGNLAQAAGSGANGRFRVPEKKASAEGEKKVVKKATKPKKAAAGEKKTTKKAAAEKPKKAKSPKKPKAEKKAKSPKKVTKPKVKKVAKSPAKKAAKPAAKKAAPKKA